MGKDRILVANSGPPRRSQEIAANVHPRSRTGSVLHPEIRYNHAECAQEFCRVLPADFRAIGVLGEWSPTRIHLQTTSSIPLHALNPILRSEYVVHARARFQVIYCEGSD